MLTAPPSLLPWQYQTPQGFHLRGWHSEPSGKPLLHVLHGNGFCSLMYWPLLQRLTDQVDLFLSDAQGHGDSDHGGVFVGWEQSARLAELAFLQHKPRFGDVPAYAMGHSFGGVLTALVHSQPQSPFQAALLLDPVLFTPAMLRLMKVLDSVGLYQHQPLARKARKRRHHFADRQQAWQYFHQRGLFRGWHADALQAYIDHGLADLPEGVGLKCRPAREAEIFASFPSQLWRQLHQHKNPLSLIYGEDTYPFIPKAVQHYQQLHPELEVKQVSGGHCFMQQYPTQTASEVQQWLAQQQGQTRG